MKNSTNEQKIRRLQFQIDELKEITPSIAMDEAIARREKAIKFLETSRKPVTWKDLTAMFGFRYFLSKYYTPSPKQLEASPTP